MQMHVAICDDDRTQTDYLRSLVVQWAHERGSLPRVKVFESAESFLFEYGEDKSYDVLLLDIQMKAMDGVELAKRIRKDNEYMQIIFITGFPEFIAEGYDVSALHCLIKPVCAEKLFPVLDKACKNLKTADKSLFVVVNGETARIPFSEIRFIEANAHYVLIRTIKDMHMTKTSLSGILEALDHRFFRCQRSFAVNFEHVRKITRASVILDNNTEVPLSRGLYDAANQAFIRFFP